MRELADMQKAEQKAKELAMQNKAAEEREQEALALRKASEAKEQESEIRLTEVRL